MTKKIIGYAFAVTLGMGTGAALSKNVSAHPTVTAAGAAQSDTDAAFRDGLFLGQRDAEQGRLRHISAGRWSATGDRAKFTTGYELGYVTATR
jgi:uncharacterized protein with FMN-binding domain